MKTYSIAIVGATGVVGNAVLSILEERQFPINNLYLLASQKSVGEVHKFRGNDLIVEDVNHFDFSQTQLCFFCASNGVSAEFAPKAAALGNIVLDKSSHFRYHQDIPLIVPEVNLQAFERMQSKIIANPNCSTIPIAVALKSIYDAVGISRINVATYQSVSGSGKDAIEELTLQSNQILNKQTPQSAIYPQTIAFNVLPHCDAFEANGYTKEEMKIVLELQKIFDDSSLAINPTTVRVPVYFGHSAALHIETKQYLGLREAIDLIKNTENVKVIEGAHPYPTPVKDAAGSDFVFVGRVRKDISHPNGINMWVVTDNIRKGAALNAIQIAEKIFGLCTFEKQGGKSNLETTFHTKF